MGKDYYKILGVEKNASKEEIKKAYKKLAKQYHPDINREADAEPKFKEVNEAASVLGDDNKRQQYDQFGTVGDGGFAGGAGGFDFSEFMHGSEGFGFDFGEVFDQFFGGGRRRRSPKRGSDLMYEIEITLEEAVGGVEKHITIPKMETCEKCDGKGAVKGSDISTCEKCNGHGMVKMTRQTPFGYFATTGTCPQCHGEGKQIRNPCSACDGNGLVEKTNKIKVEIPAGVDTGNRLRVAGEGEAGAKGGPHGDLYVMINVEPHKLFERKENNLFMKATISFSQAALGSEIDVPTIDGNARMKIPSGTQPGTMFKLRGKGVPSLRGYGSGDQLVQVQVEVPNKLSKRQKEILNEFDKESKRESKGIFGKIKDAF